MSSNETGLSTGQIIAIIVSAVVAVTLLIALPVVIHRHMVRRRQRQHDIEKIPKQELETASDSIVSRKERDGTDESRISVVNTVRSSIWGHMNRPVIPASIFDGGGDVWDSRQWPLPPGHSERYTFFSERSSMSADDDMDTEQLGEKDQDGNRTGRRLEVGSKCESIWGIAEASKVH
ncbi:hypothetical protein F4774DRAFT_123979 [Daldinia eschscholtzii]|nr:hypothetical protein F4774DRAFT_123979 [Daldinia eschscholtzii]